jgi:tRNA-splicing ligase RtcB
MKVMSTERIPIKMWLTDIEEGALKQAFNLAHLPFAFKHIAIMPDCHQGYGMPIGGVLATENVIIPNAVGVDIGCGMCAVKTSLTEIDHKTLNNIINEIRKEIPVGFKHHAKAQDSDLMPETGVYPLSAVIGVEWDSALHQLGTLGGGNHFIEIQKGSDKHIWVMIHSGSRNLGKKVADYHNKVAIALNKKWYSSVPVEYQLAFLPADTPEYNQYKREMEYCVEFALANRKHMMRIIQDILIDSHSSISFAPTINIAHNYARMENHFGKNVMVHRKGATLATKGLIGIIPGSQGTKSYIVEGLGNKESFESCSHGAGRVMGRKEAKRSLNLEDEINKLNDQGIIHGIKTVEDLDEATGAYKDISDVMKQQEDLVKIVVELTPLAVIKG